MIGGGAPLPPDSRGAHDPYAPTGLRGVPEPLALKWALCLTGYGAGGAVCVALTNLWSPSADLRSAAIALAAVVVLVALTRSLPADDVPPTRIVGLATAFAARVIIGLGFALLVGLPWTVVNAIQDGHRAAAPIVLTLVAALLGPLLIARGGVLRNLALRRLDPTVITPQDVSDRPFALYLRSFEDDLALAKPQPPAFGGKPIPAFASGATEEEHLGCALSPLGALVAVGAPGEAAPPLGATRMYLPAEDWQEPVRDLMQRARAVILVLGAGAGANWELRQAMEVVAPQRLLLVVPMDPQGYERWRDEVGAGLVAPGQLMPVRLPEFTGEHTIFSRIQGLIYFSAGWQATFERLHGDRLRYSPLRVALEDAIMPFFAQLRAYERSTG